ncbi:caspase family protein [Dyadobacter sp.]
MNKRPCYRRFERIVFKYAVSGLFAILFLGTGSKSYCQSFFYFENKISISPDSTLTYYTFLTQYDNGRGIARIRYTEPSSGENRLVEINLRDSADARGGLESQEHFLIDEGEPLPIQGAGLAGFLMPRFVFKMQKEEEDVFYVPDAIAYQWPDGSWRTSEMLVNQQKSNRDLKKERDLVSVFFNESDAFYLYLYAMRTSPRDPTKRKEKLYLITVANTLDSTIAKSTRRDVANVVKIFTQLTTDANMDMLTQMVIDSALSKRAVELVLAKLRPSPVDIVVFYYSGHGFRYSNDKSEYPRMSLRTSQKAELSKNNMSVEGIYKVLLTKKARVTIVLSDCCNDDIGEPVPSGPTLMKSRGPSGDYIPVLNKGVMNRLFFPQKPLAILIGSADRNQLAVGNPSLGGYFTNSLTVELRKVLYGMPENATWVSILANTKKQASWLSLSAACGDNRCVQSARFAVTP